MNPLTTVAASYRSRARGGARALVLTTVLATSFFPVGFARADDDAEDRYHEAYALEVVDGEVAAAARAYLALVDDDTAPASLRTASRFRFAVCAVLLGRSDEARTLLSGLADDASVPEALRARAREYRKAISDVGVGSEIGKKLQSLVFELGRVPITEESPSVYRDFAILGGAARPFLIRLLGHSDAAVRRHAMRILCRMDEPDLMALWTPEIGIREGQLILDIGRYVAARPAQLVALEERLLALDDEALGGALTRTDYSVARGGLTFSMDFVRTLRRRGISTDLCFKAIDGQRGAAKWTLLVEWSQADDDALAAEVSRRLLVEAAKSVPEGGVEPGRLELWTRRTLGVQFTYFRGKVHTLGDGLRAIAARASVAEVHAALDLVIESSHGWSDTEDRSPAERGLGGLFAGVLDERRDDDALDVARVARSLTALVMVHLENMAARRQWLLSVPAGSFGDDLSYLRRTLARLDGDRLDNAVEALLGSDFDYDGVSSELLRAVCLRALPLENVALVPRAMTVLGALTPARRTMVLRDLAQVDFARDPSGKRPLTPGMADVLTRSLPSLAREALSASEVLAPAYMSALTVLDPVVAQDRFVELVRVLAENPTQNSDGVIYKFFAPLNQTLWPTRLMHVIAPALDRLYDVMRTPGQRRWFVENLVQAVGADLDGTRDFGGDREALVQFTRRHYDLAAARLSGFLVNHRSTFPIEDWAALVQSPPWPGYLATSAGTPEMDALARALTRDTAEINDSVVGFVVHLASEDVRREVIDRLLREAPVDRLPPVARVLLSSVRGRESASNSALEDAVSRLSASDAAHYQAMSVFAEQLMTRQPSERLFPAVRWLLERPEREAVLSGIKVANSLGRTDLIPDLISRLDSMERTHEHPSAAPRTPLRPA